MLLVVATPFPNVDEDDVVAELELPNPKVEVLEVVVEDDDVEVACPPCVPDPVVGSFREDDMGSISTDSSSSSSSISASFTDIRISPKATVPEMFTTAIRSRFRA